MNKYLNFKESLKEILILQEPRLGKVIDYELVWLFLEDTSPNCRKRLRATLRNHESLNIILVSPDEEVGNLAWKSNVYSFLWIKDNDIFPYYTYLLERLSHKIKYKPISRKIKIKYQGGVDIFLADDICYAVGDGNYTVLYLATGVKKTITLKLKNLNDKISGLPQFSRIGKSFVVNLEKIKSIKGDSILFNAEKGLKLNLSPLYKRRLIKELLWY